MGRCTNGRTRVAYMRDGLALQTTALANTIAQGMTDSPVHSIGDAIGVRRTIDTVRDQLSSA